MQTQYSQQLILEAISCFKQEHGLTLSPEQANEYLNSLGALYLAFLKKPACPADKSAGGGFLVDKPSGNDRGVSNTSDTLQDAT